VLNVYLLCRWTFGDRTGSPLAVIDSVLLTGGVGLLKYVTWPAAIAIGLTHLVTEVSVMLFLYPLLLDWIAKRRTNGGN
jgi:hypothetical protein